MDIDDQALYEGVALTLGGVAADVLAVDASRDVRPLRRQHGPHDEVVVVGDGQRRVVTAERPIRRRTPRPDMVRHRDDVRESLTVDRRARHHQLAVLHIFGAVAERPPLRVTARLTGLVDLGPVREHEPNLRVSERLSDQLEGVWCQLVVVVDLDEDVTLSDHECLPFDFADVAARANHRSVCDEPMPFIGCQPPQVTPGEVVRGVVPHDPRPVGVRLCFE